MTFRWMIFIISLLFINIFTNRKSPACLHIVSGELLKTKYAGLPDQPNHDIIIPCSIDGVISVFLADLNIKHRRVASDDWYSLGVALFLFLVCIFI